MARLLAWPLLAAGMAVAAATGFILHVLWPGWQGPPLGPNAPTLPVTVAGVAFNVPPAAIRVPIQRQPGAHERIDLAFLWPSLQPPEAAPLSNDPPKASRRRRRSSASSSPSPAARDTLAPDERVKTIYPRYLESEPVAGPEGLRSDARSARYAVSRRRPDL